MDAVVVEAVAQADVDKEHGPDGHDVTNGQGHTSKKPGVAVLLDLPPSLRWLRARGAWNTRVAAETAESTGTVHASAAEGTVTIPRLTRVGLLVLVVHPEYFSCVSASNKDSWL